METKMYNSSMSPMNTKFMLMIPEGARNEIMRNPFEFIFNVLVGMLIMALLHGLINYLMSSDEKDDKDVEILELYEEVDRLKAVITQKDTKIENLLNTVSAMKCDGDDRVKKCEKLIDHLNEIIQSRDTQG